MKAKEKNPKPYEKIRLISEKTRKNHAIKVIIRGLLLLLPLIFLSYIGFRIRILLEILFLQVTFLLKILGVPFETFAYQITAGNLTSVIGFDCTGWRQLYIYFALVLLPPGIEIAKRLRGWLFLIPLYFYNTLRAVCSIWVGYVNYGWFKPVHYFLWDFVFLVLMFLFWERWYRKEVLS